MCGKETEGGLEALFIGDKYLVCDAGEFAHQNVARRRIKRISPCMGNVFCGRLFGYTWWAWASRGLGWN